MAPRIVSRAAGRAFLGYLQAQKQRMLGERGGRHGVSKDEGGVGYDTKYAMHMLRLGHQGVELLRTGKMAMPMSEPARGELLDVRMGKADLNDVLTKCGELEAELKDLLGSSPLQETPDSEGVEKWMLDVYWETWKARYGNPVNDLRKQLGLPKRDEMYGPAVTFTGDNMADLKYLTLAQYDEAKQRTTEYKRKAQLEDSEDYDY